MTAHALFFSYGTGEELTARNCVAGSTSSCDDLSPIYDQVFGGSPGGGTAIASTTFTGAGGATAVVSLSGVIGAPILRASAATDPGYRVSTNSFALQSYTYTGTSPTTRTFGGTITYSQNLVAGLGLTGANADGINAVIYLFNLPSSTLDFGTDPVSNFIELCCVAASGATNLLYSQYTDQDSAASGSGTVGVTVTLNPGETIWVLAAMQTPADDGSSIDALHTFITGWDNTTDLAPAITVPEPATLALLAVGFAAIGFVMWRSRISARAGEMDPRLARALDVLQHPAHHAR